MSRGVQLQLRSAGRIASGNLLTMHWHCDSLLWQMVVAIPIPIQVRPVRVQTSTIPIPILCCHCDCCCYFGASYANAHSRVYTYMCRLQLQHLVPPNRARLSLLMVFIHIFSSPCSSACLTTIFYNIFNLIYLAFHLSCFSGNRTRAALVNQGCSALR